LHFILKFIIIKLQKKRRKKMNNKKAIEYLKEAREIVELEAGDYAQEMYDSIDLAIDMFDSWDLLEETITEIRDNNEDENITKICKFLINYMQVLRGEIK